MSSEALESLRPPDALTLRHIGLAPSSIRESGQSFGLALGATWDGKIVFDPIRELRVTFLQGRSHTDPLIELVEPRGDDSPVTSFLQKGGGPHHLCYEVADLENHLASCKPCGTIVIRQPVPAVAFDGRRVAWALTKKRLLMEFLERE